MKLKYAKKDEIPADVVDTFVEFNEDGQVIYVHKELADTLKDTYRTKGDLTQANTKLSELSETVKTLKSSLEDKNRDQLTDQGKYKEIAEDWEKRYKTDLADRDEKIKELTNAGRQTTKKAAINKLAAKGTEETRSTLARVVSLDLDFNDDGELVVLGEDGKATSLTLDEYEKTLNERYPALVAEVPSSGGGAKGAKGGSPGAQKWADYSAAELSEIRKTTPELYEKLKATR